MAPVPSMARRVVLVTGGARGLGAGTARRLAARGARIALVGLEPEELERQAAACGPDALWWEADVTDGARLAEVAGEVAERWGGIDAVVANAGIATGGTVRHCDPEAFDRVIEVNLLGQVRTARAVLPHLIARRGYYLQIASAAAILPVPALAAYCASKAGVEAFTHALAGEVRHHGVDVGVAYLSWVDTDMVRGTDEHPTMRGARAALPGPLGRTHSVEAASAAIADAVARRRAHVMFPRWLWGAFAVRGPLQPVVTRLGARGAARADAVAQAHPERRVRTVGAGGAADERARRRAGAGPEA